MSWTQDNFSRIAAGAESDQCIYVKFARASDLTTASKDVWETAWNGEAEVLQRVDLLVGETLLIQRQDPTNDQTGGVGAQKLHVDGLRADGHFQHAVYDLDGVDEIETTEEWLRVFRAFIDPPQGPGGDDHVPCVGNISLVASTSGTLQARVLAGLGATFMTQMTIPRGMVGVGIRLVAMTGIGKEVALTVRHRSISPVRGAFTVSREYDISNGPVMHTDSFFLPELTDIHFEALVSGGQDAKLSMFFEIHLMRKEIAGQNNIHTITEQILAGVGA